MFYNGFGLGDLEELELQIFSFAQMLNELLMSI